MGEGRPTSIYMRVREILFSLVLLACPVVNLSVRGQVATEFQQLVAHLGLDQQVEDLSDVPSFSLPEPNLAYVNLTGVSSLPGNKRSIYNGWIEVYDGAGHYFRKRVRIHGQGGYSIRYPKKNISMKLCEADWSEATTTDVQWGNWVKQDGFHLKAFYTDFSRGIGEICYKMFERLVSDRQPYWSRGGVEGTSRARCIPDGFPCVLYLEGKFHGVYAWQLKKHRKNMNMKKDNALHIHLDGNISDANLFRGKVMWTQFEVRNPKDLYDTKGNAYDGNSPRELIDETSASYYQYNDTEEERLGKERSAMVKEAVVRLSQYHAELAAMEASGAGEDAIRQRFEECYDLQSLLDYVVFFYFTANGDGSLKNWQWFTYDGVKWMVTPYDMDQCLGLGLYGQVRPSFFPVEWLQSGPFFWIYKYYDKEVRQRWASLRDSGLLSGEPLVDIARDWCRRVGDDNYARERAAWPQSPCYCEAICNPGWQVFDQWEYYTVAPAYSSSATYKAGDFVKLEGRLWQATTTVHGVYPFVRNATPDDLSRLEAWIPARIAFLDKVFGYTPGGVHVSPEIAEEDHRVVGIYTLSGVRLSRPEPGICIYRYADGTSRKVRVK